VNKSFYGKDVTVRELLSGNVPSPPAAAPLYDALGKVFSMPGVLSQSAGGGFVAGAGVSQFQGGLSYNGAQLRGPTPTIPHNFQAAQSHPSSQAYASLSASMPSIAQNPQAHNMPSSMSASMTAASSHQQQPPHRTSLSSTSQPSVRTELTSTNYASASQALPRSGQMTGGGSTQPAQDATKPQGVNLWTGQGCGGQKQPKKISSYDGSNPFK